MWLVKDRGLAGAEIAMAGGTAGTDAGLAGADVGPADANVGLIGADEEPADASSNGGPVGADGVAGADGRRLAGGDVC